VIYAEEAHEARPPYGLGVVDPVKSRLITLKNLVALLYHTALCLDPKNLGSLEPGLLGMGHG